MLLSPPPDEPREHELVSPQMKALPETVLVAPILRDERFSGPERVQLATPLAHAEWPDCQSTSLVPLPDRVPPHLELFLAQLAVPVRCAMRSFSSILPSWSRSMWWPAFLRHASHLLTVITPFLPYLPVLLVPLSVHRATTLPFSRPSVAPLQ